MSSARPSLFKWSIVSVALAALASFGIFVRAQEATEPAAPNAAYVDDWTHHHLVFSNPGTRDDAVKRGKLEKWQAITNDPRYQLQQAKRTFGTRPVMQDPDLGFGPGDSWDRNRVPRGNRPPLNIFGNGVKKDWSTPLGSGTTASLIATIASTLTNGSNISSNSTLAIDGVNFNASAPTPAALAATIASTLTNGTNISGSSTLTFNTTPVVVFDASPPASAGSQTVTIGTPGSSTVSGSSTLTFNNPTTSANAVISASAPTQGTQTGAFSAVPTGSKTGPGSITIANTVPSSNTLTMTTNATGANVLGTFAGTLTKAITVSVGTTITITPTGVGTVTFAGAPASGQTTVIGGTTYTWHGTCPNFTEQCVVHSTTPAQDATNLYEAITNTCGNAGNCTVSGANAGVTASDSGVVVSVVNTTAGTLTFTNGASNTTISPATGGITAPSTACSATTGTFVGSYTTTTEATNLGTTINDCTGMWASVSGSGVTVNNDVFDSAAATLTVGGALAGTFTWGTVAAGTDGTNTCPSSTTGTFALASSGTPTTTTIASEFGLALTACNTANAVVGVTATNTGATVNAKADTPGSAPGVTLGGTFSGFSWSGGTTFTNGTDGTNSSTTFAYWSGHTYETAPQVAANIVSAVSANGTLDVPLKATEGTGANTNQITFSAAQPGTGANFTITPGTFSAFNSSAAVTLSGGTNGTTNTASNPETFAYWSGSAPVSNSTLASTIQGLVAANATLTAAMTATANTPASGDVLFDAAVPGTGANGTYTVTPGSFTAFTGGTLTGGTDGTTSAGSSNPETFAYWSGSAAVSSSTLATTIATLVGTTNANTSEILTAVATGDDITFTAKNSGVAGNYSVTPGSFSAFTGGSLSGGTTATVQPNAYPAKWGASLTTASCANDFVVYPTGQVGATTAANIIAYNNLYSGCTGTVPLTYWAFNTGTGYSVTTSPILEWLDGTKVAFIQSNGSAAQLVVVNFGGAPGGTLASPATPGTASNITTCTTPCMTVTALADNDTYSSPYYDNTNDALYVGDDGGNLEKFTGVFTGTANPARTEVSLNTGPYAITSPVYDSVSGCVFVGDTEGYLYSVNSGVAGGSVCTGAFGPYGHSENLGSGGANEGIFDGPLVDPVAQTVYVFVADSGAISTTASLSIVSPYNTFTVTSGGPLSAADDGSEITFVIFGFSVPIGTIASVNGAGNGGTLTGTSLPCELIGGCTNVPFNLSTNAAAGNNAVDEFFTKTITSGSTATLPAQAESLGTGGAGYNIYSGAFDNVYFSSTTGTGNLYALGSTAVVGGGALYQIPITNGSISGFNPPVKGLNTAEYPWPSPATEFYDNGTDYLFFSVNRGNVAGCTNTAGNGCILSYNITTTTPAISGTGLNVTTPGTNGCWATGGLVIDNSASGTTGAQQIYFVNLNGAEAGGVDGAPPASSNCTAGTGPTIQAVQAAQSSP
jgi:hypothetical protein